MNENQTPGVPDSPVTARAPGVPAALAPPTGANVPAIVIGALCLVVALMVALREVAGFEVNWQQFGAPALIVAGALLVVLGVAGMVRHNRS